MENQERKEGGRGERKWKKRKTNLVTGEGKGKGREKTEWRLGKGKGRRKSEGNGGKGRRSVNKRLGLDGDGGSGRMGK